MSSSNTYKDLSEFLAKHNAKQEKNNHANVVPTHTRIGDKNVNIYGGAYVIDKSELPTFYSLYHDSIFIKKKAEYLTEKQLEEAGPILVDFDFRYNYDVVSRQHTSQHIQDMMGFYADELKKLLVFDSETEFHIYIMEKQNINRVQDGSVTKDGIHMIIGIHMSHTLQMILREKMIQTMKDIWSDLPLTNTWDKVLDEGITTGKTNWQMYGSRKPGNEAYELTQIFKVTFDPSDGEFMMEENSVKDFDLSKNLALLSAQYDQHPHFETQPSLQEEIERMKGKRKQNSTIRRNCRTKVKLLEENDDEDQEIMLDEITNKDKLARAMDKILKELKPTEWEIKETHMYTQVLPAKYYEPGSHLLNRQVAFALKNTDERLFLSWIMLRSKADDFKYGSIPELYHDWKKYFKTENRSNNSVTRKSIMYWAKQDNYEEFLKVKRSTVDHFVEQTLDTPTEYDYAMVLYQIFKDKYVCTSLSNKSWYVYKNHKWEVDAGQSLRMAISKDMHNIYQEKLESLTNEIHHYENNDDRAEFIKKKMKSVSEICIKLKRTVDKNNIMREAMELFYDNHFVRNMDANRYLLCFSNGVYDFSNFKKEKGESGEERQQEGRDGVFRNGYPQDYITKTTGIPYIPYDEKNETIALYKNEIIRFMEQLFPIPDLNKYMWDHLASCLIGINMNQTFNIYRGSGSNGKSMLTQLMSLALGQYKGTVPITLVTEKRGNIGGTSSEVIQLKGIRYAVMQEPSKEVKLNEGIMKELTGGDPIQARALYAESETFMPQFKLVVCTNSLFEINSNDDGTWRRIRICDFLSKFVGEKETHTDDATAHIFPKDKDLEEKLPKWAPVFASMLVERLLKTKGHVDDCDIVQASSNRYRQGQDHISAYVDEMIIKTGIITDKVRKGELTNEFKIWFQNSQGVRKQPKGIELYEYMDKKFGKCKGTGYWPGIKIKYDTNKDEMDEISDE